MTGCYCPATARRWLDNGTCATCGSRPTEKQIEPVLLKVLCTGTGLVLWRNQSGHATYGQSHVDYGVGNPPGGGGDYVGIWAPTGRWVEVEMKTETGRLSAKQRARGKLVTRLGGIYAVIRSAQQARELLEWLRTSRPTPNFVFPPSPDGKLDTIGKP